MNYRFSIIKREYEDEAIIAFIDLLGTRSLYESLPTEEQANHVLNNLEGDFDIKFSDHFSAEEIKEHFDVSIFADSIVISERLATSKIIERLVDFLLDYQDYILLNNNSSSRAILMKGSFFSYKITNATTESILGSKFTNISLCGGKGIRVADKCLKGLPIGVYVTENIKRDLSDDQKARVVSVRGEALSFIKKTTPIMPFIHNDTLAHVTEDCEAMLQSLLETIPDKDLFEKKVPWILVHLGKQNEIIKV